MQYSNLKDEGGEEESSNKVTKKIAISTEVLLKKREFTWFLVSILVLIITGSIIFFCVPSGGKILSFQSAQWGDSCAAGTGTGGTPGGTAGSSKILLHTDRGYKYYKVPVGQGVRLTEGRVSETCAEAGLRAVCSGPQSCKYTDTSKCLVTPLSTNCNNPMSVSNQRSSHFPD